MAQLAIHGIKLLIYARYLKYTSKKSKSGGVIALFSQQPFTAKLVYENLDMFRYEWIWHKSSATGFLNSHKMPLKAHENILIFYDKLPCYNPQFVHGKPYKKVKSRKAFSTNYGNQRECATVSDGKRYPTDILCFNSERGMHPTQKPVALCECLIKTYTNVGETVLDNCMGSGTTGVACVNTDRNFIGIEKDDHYFKVATERINQAQLSNAQMKKM